ncbi:MAG: hypothetical protein KJS90_01290 [Acidobacteria bacterium]|nr:hypothetical protein [Acidobacteriota bacterium]
MTHTRREKSSSARRRARALEVTRELSGLAPLSDEALEVARRGLVEGLSAPRFDRLQADVFDAWSATVANNATGGSDVSRDRREEFLAEARLWLIEQLRAFEPKDGGGSCGAFIRARQNWFRSAVRRSANGQTISHGRYAVLGAVGAVGEEFQAVEHRAPGAAELKALVAARLAAQVREKILSTEAGAGLDEAALAEEVRRRLSKDGVTAALEHFDEVRLEARPDLPLQVLDADDDAPHWGVPVPTVEAPEIGVRDEEETFEALLAVALGDRQWARTAFGQRAGETASGADAESDAKTLKDLAREAGHSTAELKDVLEAARCRVLAPHAQWAHLAPGL